MFSHRWFVFSFCAVALGACSSDDGDEACSPSSVVDDPEIVSTTQGLSASEQSAVVELIDGLLGLPRLEAGARRWSEAPLGSERALVRDFVETVLIDADFDAANAAARYTALRRVVVAGDLVLARSDGEREGNARQLYDLFRVSGGRLVERWSAERPTLPAGSAERAF